MFPPLRAYVWGVLTAASLYALELIAIALGIIIYVTADSKNVGVVFPAWVFFSIPGVLGAVTLLGIWVTDLENERKREIEENEREQRLQIRKPDIP